MTLAPIPTFTHAKNRALVALPDGRTGRLFRLPGGRTETKNIGRNARVQLPSGAIVSVPVDELIIIPEEIPE